MEPAGEANALLVAALGAALLLLVVWNVVGIRMLLLARRTGATPELTLGLGLFLMAALGYPVSVLAQVPGLSDAARLATNAVATLCTDLGVVFLYIFTWRVFRPASRGADLWVLAVIGAATLHLCGWLDTARTAASQAEMLKSGLGWAYLQLALVGLSFGWAGAESLRHGRMARRRLRLGLADPVVVDRILLWGAMGALGAVVTVVDAGLIVLYGARAQNAIVVFTSLSGVTMSALLWLAFFPPRAYTRWVAARG